MNVAVIGAGRQGMRRCQAISDLGSDTVSIVVDVDQTAARALGSKMGCAWTTRWDEAVASGADAVAVCVTPDAHFEIVHAALSRGSHVLCEKPLAPTAADARRMVAVAEAAGRVLKCGFNYRHHPAIAQAHAWVRAGRIGSLRSVNSRHGTGGRRDFDREWRTRPERSGGGVLIDQGIHILDLLRWFDVEVRTVVGSTITAYWPIAPVDDNAFAILRGDDALATLHVSWTQWKPVFWFELLGTEGSLVVDGLGGSYGLERLLYQRGGGHDTEVVEYRGPDISWRDEWREFTAAIAEHREPCGSGRDGAEALALVEALYEASTSRCALALERRVPGTPSPAGGR